MDNTISFCKNNGFAETLLKRRKYFNDISSRNANLRKAAERAAINMPIQGTAADMMKLAMIAIDKKMTENKMKSKMVLQVHDELVFDTYKPELEFLKDMVINEMQNAFPLGNIPVIVDTGVGKNWFEAH